MKRILSLLFLMGCCCVAVSCTTKEEVGDLPFVVLPPIRQGDLNDGDAAPDFTLKDVAGTKSVMLSQLQGKPVVLLFGSCTCPKFVASMPTSEKLYADYKDRVHFYIIYVREAHPTDGVVMPNNQFQITSPKSIAERNKVAEDFADRLKVSIPILVDDIDDPVDKAYAGWPNRLYILDVSGKIADKGLAAPLGVSSTVGRAAETLDKLLADSK